MRALGPIRFATVVAHLHRRGRWPSSIWLLAAMWLMAAWFAGCNGAETSVAEQAIAGTGRVPDVKLAWWISSIDPLACAGELGGDLELYQSMCCTPLGGCEQPALCGNLVAACGGLVTSANPDAPTSFSDATNRIAKTRAAPSPIAPSMPMTQSITLRSGVPPRPDRGSRESPTLHRC